MSDKQHLIERLAIEQAIYNAIGADVKTNVVGNLRSEVNSHFLDLYESTGATGFEVRVNGQRVGSYGFNKVKGTPAREVTELQVTDVHALRECADDDFLDFCGRYVSEHIEELGLAYCEHTGELIDGIDLVTRTVPATPDGIRPGGTLRVSAEKVADALGPQLTGAIAGLLGGGAE